MTTGHRSGYVLRVACCVLVGALGLIAGLGMLGAPRLHADPLGTVFPPDKSILVERAIEPADFANVSSGGTITVTIAITNNEDVALRGLYYSDQVPDGWAVGTANVSVNGSSIVDYTFEQGYAGEICAGFAPRRWALETPQGEGIFAPTHPILASGGTARIVFTMIVSGGTGGDYSAGHDAWAGWLATASTGTAVFGYQGDSAPTPTATGTPVSTAVPPAGTPEPPPLTADFSASPRSGAAPLTVTFTDLSVGDILSREWDFGDRGTALLPGPVHTYSGPGFYTVSLTVQDAHGSDVLVRPGYVHVMDGAHNVYLPVILRSLVP